MEEEVGSSLAGASAGFSSSAYSETIIASTGSALIAEGLGLIIEGQQLLNGALCIFTGISSLGATLGSDKVTQNFNKERVLNDSVNNINPSNKELQEAIGEITRTR